MANTFISHSSKDGSFVNRLVQVLNDHGVETWSSTHDLVGGDDWKDKINLELDAAQTLVVLISKHSAESEWVPQEIQHFRDHLNRRVIPIRLDETDADSIDSHLQSYQIVDFSSDHIQGYMTLLAIFGKSFSFIANKNERRSSERRGGERRSGERREDNRRSDDKLSLPRRLRVGFIKSYSQGSRSSDFHEIDLLRRTQMMKLLGYLKNEAKKYSFLDMNGESIAPEKALEHTLNKSWEAMREISATVKAAYLIDEIVGEMFDSYQIDLIDRRADDLRIEDRREAGRRTDEGDV